MDRPRRPRPSFRQVEGEVLVEDGQHAACVENIDDRSSGRPRPVSTRLKAHTREVEYVAHSTCRCVSNAFKLHAGKELIRTVALRQLLGNVLQRHRTRQIKQCSKVGISLLPRLCPDPESGEQHRSMFNEVVGGVHNEVVRGVWRPIPDVCPNLLRRLVSELDISAHVVAVSHRPDSAITAPLSSSPVSCSGRRDSQHRHPEDQYGPRACDNASARSGDGRRRFRISTFDSTGDLSFRVRSI
jgi:hypothetical protein